MGLLTLTLSLAAAEPDDGLAKKLLPIYVKEARRTWPFVIRSYA
jgi:hypothetical protein